MQLFLANSIALFHGLVVLPVITIIPLMIAFGHQKNRMLERLFITLGSLTVLSFIIFGGCFLTNWEKGLRTAAGVPSYSDGFVRHYLGLVGVHIPDIATTITLVICIAVGMISLLRHQKTRP